MRWGEVRGDGDIVPLRILAINTIGAGACDGPQGGALAPSGTRRTSSSACVPIASLERTRRGGYHPPADRSSRLFVVSDHGGLP